jgi:transposase
MFRREGHTLYHVQLSEEQREELQQRTRMAGIKPRTRDRLEMVRLSDAGWRVPQISRHLRVSPRRVRFWLKQFLADGFDALPDQPHPGQASQLTPELVAAVRQELGQGDRTWTLRQLAAWLEETHGLCLSPKHLGDLLRRVGLSCRRTERVLDHKQEAEAVAVAKADLETLEKGAIAGAWMSVM